jgi:hypothetical protein
VAWLVSYDAIRAPATAARCPAVLAVLAPEVAAAVSRLAGLPPPPGLRRIEEVSRFRLCEACGGELDPASRADKRFCSARCRQRHHRRRSDA